MKKINDDIANALDKCVKAITVAELSIRTGVNVATLKRFVNRRARNTPPDIFRKIYPEIRRYILLKDADDSAIRPVRIGDPPRMGHYLDDFIADEKILLDTFSSLADAERSLVLQKFEEKADHSRIIPLDVRQLSQEENRILMLYRILPEDLQQSFLLELVRDAREEMKRRRVGI